MITKLVLLKVAVDLKATQLLDVKVDIGSTCSFKTSYRVNSLKIKIIILFLAEQK